MHELFVSFLLKMTHCAEAVGKGLKKEKKGRAKNKIEKFC